MKTCYSMDFPIPNLNNSNQLCGIDGLGATNIPKQTKIQYPTENNEVNTHVQSKS